MKTKITAILLSIFLSKWTFGQKISSYDIELQKSRAVIENVRVKLNATQHLFDTKKSATKIQTSKNSLSEARHWNKIEECHSVIREFQSFVRNSQSISPGESLESLQALGKCFQKREKWHKAFTNYRRYVSTYVTSEIDDQAKLLSVLKNLITIAGKSTTLTKTEASELISSLSTINANRKVNDRVKLWSAQLAQKFGFTQTAEEWFEQVYSKEKTDVNVKISALYRHCLIKFENNENQEAKKLLKRAIELGKKNNLSANVYLTMARLYVHDHKYESALQYYKMINKKSPDFQDALFESVIVALKAEKNRDALKYAAAFKSLFPKADESVTLNNILAYLHLKAGDLPQTEEVLKKAEQKYDSASQWIKTNFAFLEQVPQTAIEQLNQRIRGTIQPVPTISLATQIFERISSSEKELAQSRNNLRRLIFVMGRSHLDRLEPHWTQKAKELKNLSISLLTAAHRLAASELMYLKPFIEEHDLKRLENLRDQRLEMYSTLSMNRFKKGSWVRWFNYEKSNESLEQKLRKLQKSKARLSSAILIANGNTSKYSKYKNRLAALSRKTSDSENYIYRGKEIVRKSQINIKMDLAELPAFKRFFLTYANSLFAEQKTMSQYRGFDERFAQEEVKAKFRAAWSEWEHVAQKAYAQIDKFEGSAIQQLARQSSTIDRHLKEYGRLTTELNNYRSKVESILSKNIKTIVKQYEMSLSEKKSKLKKWHGDVRWLGFESSKESSKKMRKKYLLERELLNANF